MHDSSLSINLPHSVFPLSLSNPRYIYPLCLTIFLTFFLDHMPALILYHAWYFAYFCFFILHLSYLISVHGISVFFSLNSISVLFNFCAWQFSLNQLPIYSFSLHY
jgi:hypothetical protein